MRAIVATFLLLTGWVGSQEPATSPHSFDALLQPVFAAKCIQCHGQDGKVKGKVNLLEIQSTEDLLAQPALLATLRDVIDFNEMPPEDEPQLDASDRKHLLASLEGLIEKSIAGTEEQPSRAPIRRMNRMQYDHAVRDLFQLNRSVYSIPERMMRTHQDYFDPARGTMADLVKVGSRPLGKSQMIEPRLAGVAPFPQDLRAEHGFDNRGDHLSLSPMLLESFLQLSQSIVDSHDFHPRNVGIWNEFFQGPGEPIPNPPPAPPKKDAQAETMPESSPVRIAKGSPPAKLSDEELRNLLESRIRPFLRRGFRRPITEAVLSRYVDYAFTATRAGVPLTQSMKQVASAVLASPRFLYLYDGQNEASAFNLAARMSFFLWGTIPDTTLLDQAADGTLLQEDVLDAEITRMLNDRKTKRFCDSFPAQWLQLDRIISAVPDRAHHPYFYFSKYRMSMHMMLEPLLLFECIYLEDRSILELIDSDYTFRSEPLNQFYDPGNGKPVGRNPGTLSFNRIKLDDRRHGGVITTAACMTMTSGPEHSKPITRGAWLTTVVFNNPPEPPPANVPPLSEEPPAGEEDLTLRERLGAHRERADCAGCHEKIDPLGFALENYGPTGVWRDLYENGRDVDMQGTLFRRHPFKDVVEFKDALLKQRERFARAFGGHLLSYGLARELETRDLDDLDAIKKAAVDNDYRIRAILRAVIHTEAFRH